ncbi:MAG: hypothetical protein ACLR4Z_10540 [Butyricicoccaceae bacterium]
MGMAQPPAGLDAFILSASCFEVNSVSMENIQCSQKINGIPAGEESGGFRNMKKFHNDY